jgi:hypothetical protein
VTRGPSVPAASERAIRAGRVPELLSAAGYARLCELSGNRCAYPGCGRPVSTAEHGAARHAREAAYIFAEVRQGPRWRSECDEEERRGALNHVLLCGEHHRIVDGDLRIYSVGVLAKMKSDHESAMAGGPLNPPSVAIAEEEVRLTALPVVGVPAMVYAADALKEDFSSTCRAILHRGYRPGRSDLTPFLQMKRRIWAFHDLSRPDGPFSKVVQRNTTTSEEARAMWSTDDGRRRYVRLLEKVLHLHLVERGLEWDRERRRYWFPAEVGGGHRVTEVRSRSGQPRTRLVAYEQQCRSAPASGPWRHWALECQFERVGSGWALTIRPAYQWTTDGSTPLDVASVSRRVSRELNFVHHAQYLDQVSFWHSWLTRGRPRLVSQIAGASLVLSADAPATTVAWPAIGDDAFSVSGLNAEDAIAVLDYQRVLDLELDELYGVEPDPEPSSVGSVA